PLVHSTDQNKQNFLFIAQRLLIWLLIADPIIRTLGYLYYQLRRINLKQIFKKTGAWITHPTYSTSLYFSIILFGFGMVAYIYVGSLELASMIWLLSWLISAADLYRGLARSEGR